MADLNLLLALPPLRMMEDNRLFFRLSVLSPARIGKNDRSGPVHGPVSLFRDLRDRPVSGVFAGSLTEKRYTSPDWGTGNFAWRKTGLFRTCFF